jgi:hypothetical protein
VISRLGDGTFGLFSCTPIGIGVWLVGGLVMVMVADRQLRQQRLPHRGGHSRGHRKALLLELNDWPVDAALLELEVFLFTTLLTEVISNIATMAMLIPIAGQLAVGLGQPAMAFKDAVLLGASQSFLSPVRSQANLMVFGPGRHRFREIARQGFQLTIAMAQVVPWLTRRSAPEAPLRRSG